MHRNQEYTDLEAVQAELSPMVMELAPPGMPANQRVSQQNSLFVILKQFMGQSYGAVR